MKEWSGANAATAQTRGSRQSGHLLLFDPLRPLPGRIRATHSFCSNRKTISLDTHAACTSPSAYGSTLRNPLPNPYSHNAWYRKWGHLTLFFESPAWRRAVAWALARFLLRWFEGSGGSGGRHVRCGVRREMVRIMSEKEPVIVETDERGIARVTLNRPEARNALSDELMEQLCRAFRSLAENPEIRAVVLSGNGSVFCAGGDLKGMKRQASATREGRLRDAAAFAATLREIGEFPGLLIGRIGGSAFGGGVGLMSLCDVAIGLSDARYQLTEVTLGLIAATISPWVVRKTGAARARRIMLHAVPLDGHQAASQGLLDEVVDTEEELDAAVNREIAHVLRCAPGAVRRTKRLLQFVSTHDTEANTDYTVQALADAWETDDIREGIDAFLNKRRPKWAQD